MKTRVLFLTGMLVMTALTGVTVGDASSVSKAHTGQSTIQVSGKTAQADNVSNTTTRHQNPESVDEQGDLDAVQRHLTSRLRSQLSEASIKISQGEYQRGESLLDEEYQEALSKYVDVAGETESNEDDQTAETFREGRAKQRRFANQTRQFRRTYKNYRIAKQRNNATRARELARELDRIAAQVNQSGSNVSQSLVELSNETGLNTTDIRQTIQTVERNITQTTSSVVQTELVRTRLRVQADDTEASFLRPLTIRGRLVRMNGSPVGNRTINLRIGYQRVQVRTDQRGRFQTIYRPTLLSVNRSTVRIEYIPAIESLFLGAQRSVPIDVTQVEAKIQIQRHAERLRFNDEVFVTGRVTVQGVGVDNLPVNVLVNETGINTTVSRNGAFTVSPPLPATVPSGDHRLTVRLPFDGRAIATTTADVPVTVLSSDSTLSLSVSRASQRQSEGQSVVVSGALTAETEPVSNQPITIRINDTAVRTVRTNQNGRYRAVINAETFYTDPKTKQPINVSAVFGGQQTNLNASTAGSIRFVLPPLQRQTTVSEGISAIPEWGWIGLGGLGLMVVGGSLLVIRRYQQDQEERETVVDGNVGEDQPSTPEIPDKSQLEQARTALRNGDAETAIRLAYNTTREQLATRFGLEPTYTHWEFYDACRSTDRFENRVTELRELTESYERAVFAPEAVDDETAATTIETVQRIFDLEPSDGVTAD